MTDAKPIVLVASVSREEGRRIERELARAGWTVLPVDDADQAARHLNGAGPNGALVIDAGLLQMAHDAQWRVFRAGHPELGTVVRSFVAGEQPRRGEDDRTLHVRPDDFGAMCRAVRRLCPA